VLLVAGFIAFIALRPAFLPASFAGRRSPSTPGYHFIDARSLSHPFISSPAPSLLAAVRQARALAPTSASSFHAESPDTARRVEHTSARNARKSKQRRKIRPVFRVGPFRIAAGQIG